MCSTTAHGQSERLAFSATADDAYVAQADADDTPAPKASTTPKEGGAPSELEIENIVVSSRKRNERVQRIPIAITALDESDLQEIGANRIPLISPLIPNASFTFQGGTSSRLTLRGLAEFDPSPAVDPAVGTYVDGVYQARVQSGQQALFDLERIEVLRGPQGTVFGKNTLAGAINIQTNNPTFEQEGDVSVKVGNYKLFETRATGNVPLIEDRLAARIALATNKRDGFQRDTVGGDRDDDALLAGRFKLLYFPSESLELLFSFDQSKEQRVLAGAKCKLTDTSTINDPTTFQGVLNVFGYQQQCAAIQGADEDRVAANVDGSEKISNRGTSFRATYAINPDLTFTSLTAWRSLDGTNPYDLDMTTLDVFQENLDSEQDQYTQEFQLAGATMGGQLEYLVGVFGFMEHVDTKNSNGGFFSTVTGADVVNPFPITGDPATDADITASLIRGPTERADQENDNLVYSVYTQIRYNITPELQFVGGVRFEEDSRRIYRRITAISDSMAGCTTSAGLPVPIGTVCQFYDRSERFSDFQPSASLSYRFTDNVLGYASYGTGFKGGSFNPRSINNDLGFITASDGTIIPQLIENVSVDPAKQTTYEIGAKSTFSDGRVQLNAAAFYSLYDAIQTLSVSSFTPGSLAPGFGNDADSVITGAELETLLLPLPNLRLGATLGFTNDRYTSFDEPLVNTLGARQIGDQRLPFTSRYTYAVSADYLIDTGMGQLSFGASWAAKTKQYFDPENSDSIDQGKVGTLTGRLGLLFDDGKTELSLVGTNLLDREYDVFGVNLTPFLGATQTYEGAPRQYGLEIRRRF